MDPFVRSLVLFGGLAFCVFFAALTTSVAVQDGVDIAVVISFAIIALVMLGILGAIRNPPRD
jgi:hypothetical protein